MGFLIHESRILAFEKKMDIIKRKCEKYNKEFKYRRIGETFQEVTIEENFTILTRFFEVEFDSNIILNENWKVIGTIDFTDNGNIIKCFDENDNIPKRFFHTTNRICDHCNTKRDRVNVILIKNKKTGEIKQVGKNCLKEYTNIDLELVAIYMQVWETCKDEKTVVINSKGYKHMVNVKEMLLYAIETINLFGYVKSDSDDAIPTKWVTNGIYLTKTDSHGLSWQSRKHYQEMIDKYNFNENTEANKKEMNDMIDWILNKNVANNIYLNNLQNICKNEYISIENIGFLVSLPIAYRKEMEKIEKEKEKEKATGNSDFIGKVGDKIEVTINKASLVTSYITNYGICFVYKFIDTNDNVLVWKTSKAINNLDVKKVSGTIKEHNTFNKEKQTVITRCKLA